jgi:hypothetical protein
VRDKIEVRPGILIDPEHEEDFLDNRAREETLARELSFLFGEDVVEQSRLIDIADLNLHDDVTAKIGEGIRQLKALKHDPLAQRQWVHKQSPGLSLLLCLWIMDMDILDKIQTRSYL